MIYFLIVVGIILLIFFVVKKVQNKHDVHFYIKQLSETSTAELKQMQSSFATSMVLYDMIKDSNPNAQSLTIDKFKKYGCNSMQDVNTFIQAVKTELSMRT